MLRYTLLILLVSYTEADQLANLINFVRGNGANPVGAGSAPASLGSAPQQRVAAPSVGLAAPIPFSEPADPSRGRVQIDVPQPKLSSPQAPLMSREQLIEASSPPKFSGLPAGATQVGGNTLSLQVRQRNRPAPLSEVQAPIFLSEAFPSPLNDVNPVRPALPEPVDALQHRFLPGNIPSPINVNQQSLPFLSVLNEPRIEQGIHRQALSYDRFADEVFNVQQGPQNLQNVQQPDLGRIQADLTHQEALTRHRQALEEAQRQQQQHLANQPLPEHQQHLRFQPQPQPLPQINQQHLHPNPLLASNSRFAIPGLNTLRQYEDELRLAQETLKALG